MIPPPAGGGARVRAFVYLLRSRKDGSFYVGWTTSILRRLVEHNNTERGEYSDKKTPWQLIGFEGFASIEAAKARERTLKQRHRMMLMFKKRMLNRAAVGSPRQVGG